MSAVSVEARRALLHRMHDLGWMNPAAMPESEAEAEAAEVLHAEGLAHKVVQDRREVWRLTDAGVAEATK